MANLSTVQLKAQLYIEGQLPITPPQAFLELLVKNSYDLGFINDDQSLLVFGRWSYDHMLDTTEMTDALRWVRERRYDELMIDYVEYEEGAEFVAVGRLVYTFNDRGSVDMSNRYMQWTPEEYADAYLANGFPDMDDYETDDDFDDDGYSAAIDRSWEAIDADLVERFMTRGYLANMTLPNQQAKTLAF